MRGARPSRWGTMFAAATLLGASSPAPLAAQWDPDWDWTATDTYQHAAGGALLDLAIRLPLVPKSFRDTAPKRLLVVAVIGFVYEVGQWDVAHSAGLSGPGFGLSGKDLIADVVGALTVEGVIALGRAVMK